MNPMKLIRVVRNIPNPDPVPNILIYPVFRTFFTTDIELGVVTANGPEVGAVPPQALYQL